MRPHRAFSASMQMSYFGGALMSNAFTLASSHPKRLACTCARAHTHTELPVTALSLTSEILRDSPQTRSRRRVLFVPLQTSASWIYERHINSAAAVKQRPSINASGCLAGRETDVGSEYKVRRRRYPERWFKEWQWCRPIDTWLGARDTEGEKKRLRLRVRESSEMKKSLR